MGCEKVVWWEFSSQHNSSSSKSIIGSTKKKCFLSGQKIYIFRENNEGGEGDEHNEIYILLKWCRASWWWIKDSDNIEIKGLLAIYISSSFAVVFIANTLPFKSELKVLWNAENFQKNFYRRRSSLENREKLLSVQSAVIYRTNAGIRLPCKL